MSTRCYFPATTVFFLNRNVTRVVMAAFPETVLSSDLHLSFVFIQKIKYLTQINLMLEKKFSICRLRNNKRKIVVPY